MTNPNTKHNTPSNADWCKHGKGWGINCADCGRTGIPEHGWTEHSAITVRLEMLEHAVFSKPQPVIDAAPAEVAEPAQSPTPAVSGELYVPEQDTWVRVAEVNPRDTEPSVSVGDVVYVSNRGIGEGINRGWLFLETSEDDIGTWCRVEPAAAPASSDAGVIRAAEGVTLEPGEYEVVEVAACEDNEPERARVGSVVNCIGRYTCTLSVDGWRWLLGVTLLTAVRRVEPAAEPVADDSGSLCAWCNATRTVCARGKQCDERTLARIAALTAEHVRDQLFIGLEKGRVANLTQERAELRAQVTQLQAERDKLTTEEPDADLTGLTLYQLQCRVGALSGLVRSAGEERVKLLANVIALGRERDRANGEARDCKRELERVTKERDEALAKVSGLELEAHRSKLHFEIYTQSAEETARQRDEARGQLTAAQSELASKPARIAERERLLFEEQHKGERAEYALSASLGMTTFESDGSMASTGGWDSMITRAKDLTAQLSARDAELGRLKNEACAPHPLRDPAMADLHAELARLREELKRVDVCRCARSNGSLGNACMDCGKPLRVVGEHPHVHEYDPSGVCACGELRPIAVWSTWSRNIDCNHMEVLKVEMEEVTFRSLVNGFTFMRGEAHFRANFTHVRDPAPSAAPNPETVERGEVTICDFGPHHGEKATIVDTDSDGALLRLSNGESKCFLRSEYHVDKPAPLTGGETGDGS